MVVRTDLLERYTNSLPEASRRQFVARAQNFLGWLRDREPSVEVVRDWLKKRQRDGYADGTIALEFGIIRRLFVVNGLEWPFRRGEGPIIREHQVYAPALDPEDIKAMVDVVLRKAQSLAKVQPDDRHRCFLCLATIWGLRREEMQEMSPEFLDMDNRLIFVETVHRGRQRWHTVPDYLMSHIEPWGFRQTISLSRLSELFVELKKMIGLTVEEVGWHAIRRSCVMAAWEAGFTEPEIHSFYRWKRSSSNMPLLYGTSRVVGRAGTKRQVLADDARVDEAMYERHPFPKMWKE